MATTPQLAQSPYLNLDAAYTRAFAYDASGNVIYMGWAVPLFAVKANAVWRIAKLTYDASNNVTDITWANGQERFTNIWDNRASLSYT